MDRHAAARANVAVGSFATGSNRQQIQRVRDSAANHYVRQ